MKAMIARLIRGFSFLAICFVVGTLIAQTMIFAYVWKSWDMDDDKVTQMMAIARGRALARAFERLSRSRRPYLHRSLSSRQQSGGRRVDRTPGSYQYLPQTAGRRTVDPRRRPRRTHSTEPTGSADRRPTRPKVAAGRATDTTTADTATTGKVMKKVEDRGQRTEDRGQRIGDRG